MATRRPFDPIQFSAVFRAVLFRTGTLMILFLAGAAHGQLAPTKFVDPKGYFSIVPPEGWRVQEYPADPRGKIALFAPDASVELRVLVNAVDFSTLDALVASLGEIERQVGFDTNIKRTDFEGIPAVERTFSSGGTRFLYVDFLVAAVDHNLAYSAPNESFEKHLPTARLSMQTYEPVLKYLSSTEQKEHALAKKRRVAELLIGEGNRSLASQYVEEGLSIEPNDAKLLELNRQLQSDETPELLGSQPEAPVEPNQTEEPDAPIRSQENAAEKTSWGWKELIAITIGGALLSGVLFRAARKNPTPFGFVQGFGGFAFAVGTVTETYGLGLLGIPIIIGVVFGDDIWRDARKRGVITDKMAEVGSEMIPWLWLPVLVPFVYSIGLYFLKEWLDPERTGDATAVAVLSFPVEHPTVGWLLVGALVAIAISGCVREIWKARQS